MIYEAQTVEELETAFRNAVDDYLRSCAQMGEAPETPRQRRDAALGG